MRNHKETATAGVSGYMCRPPCASAGVSGYMCQAPCAWLELYFKQTFEKKDVYIAVGTINYCKLKTLTREGRLQTRAEEGAGYRPGQMAGRADCRRQAGTVQSRTLI